MHATSHSDSLSFLQMFESGHTDCVFTSPPYAIGEPYEGGKFVTIKGHRRLHTDLRSRLPSHDEYANNLEAIVFEIARILRPGGALGWQVGYRYDADNNRTACNYPIDAITLPLLEKAGLVIHQRIIWINRPGFPVRRRLRRWHETILWMIRPGGEMTANTSAIPNDRRKKDGSAYGDPSDIWEIPATSQEVRKALGGRECIMPLELAKRFITLTTNKGDSVVDPFGGTGTTATAAAILLRQGYSCDREHRAHKLSAARLEPLSIVVDRA